MNNKNVLGRETGRITCAWIATGDLRNPFVRVWSEVSLMRDVLDAPSSSRGAEAERVLCA